jgi:hypothetical protein
VNWGIAECFLAPDISYRKIIFDKIDSLSRGYLMGDNLPKNSFGDTIKNKPSLKKLNKKH